jgi:hypothetical protein
VPKWGAAMLMMTQQLAPRLNRLEGGARRWWARAMPPLWQYSCARARQTSPLLPPKGENRGPRSGYSCKSSIFRVPQWGAMTSVMATPDHSPDHSHLRSRDLGWTGGLTGGRGRCPRCGSTSRVCREKSHSSSFAHPNASAPRRSRRFPCKEATSEVPQMGPRVPSWTPVAGGCVCAGAGSGGSAHVVAVLLASAKPDESRQTSPLRPPKGTNHGPQPLPPAN